MHIVKKDFKGSPDGYTVIEYRASDDPVEIPQSLVGVATEQGWIEPAKEQPQPAEAPAETGKKASSKKK